MLVYFKQSRCKGAGHLRYVDTEEAPEAPAMPMKRASESSFASGKERQAILKDSPLVAERRAPQESLKAP